MDKVYVSMERGYYYIDLWINMIGRNRGAMLPSGRSLILPKWTAQAAGDQGKCSRRPSTRLLFSLSTSTRLHFSTGWHWPDCSFKLVDVNQTALFPVEINQTAFFYWSTSTALFKTKCHFDHEMCRWCRPSCTFLPGRRWPLHFCSWTTVDAVDVHFYSAIHHAQNNTLFLRAF